MNEFNVQGEALQSYAGVPLPESPPESQSPHAHTVAQPTNQPTFILFKLASPDMMYTRYGWAAKPVRARSAAGFTSCAQGLLPKRFQAASKPCNSPGTATARPSYSDAFAGRPATDSHVQSQQQQDNLCCVAERRKVAKHHCLPFHASHKTLSHPDEAGKPSMPSCT
jgi:hypothetical protein